jgi:alkylation response protein AidB-like acyl-CoA dehydrogenase
VHFTFSPEQQQLAASIERFFARGYDFNARRRIVASVEGWSREAWSHLAELGVLALTLPEDCGGFGGKAIDLVPFMQAAGAALLVEPYVPTVGLGARLLARAHGFQPHHQLLAAIAAGELVVAVAHAERESRYDTKEVRTRAREVVGGYVIEGEKSVVLGAPCADRIIVSARLAGEASDPKGIALFTVDRGARGLALTSYRTLDELRAADVRLESVHVPEASRIDRDGEALDLIEDALDHGTALICAEAAGAIRYANEATLDYVKTRKQFGVPIGSFQALQHRIVDMHIAGEQAHSMALLACATVDEERDATRRKHLISAAMIRIADACRQVSQEAIQLHGGMGMTEEMKISHTFRRLTMIAQQFGDVDHHLARFAASASASDALSQVHPS